MRAFQALRVASPFALAAIFAAAVHCGDDSNDAGVGAFDGSAADATRSTDAPSVDGASGGPHDAAPDDHADADGGDALPVLLCAESPPRVLAKRARNDAGKLVDWVGRSRIVRIGPSSARAVVRAADSKPELLSFDPKAQDLAVSTPLPIDVVLDTSHEDSALWIYGLRLGPETDGGVGPTTALLLLKVDDATGALTTRELTLPGTLATPMPNPYEAPLGRFVRFGSDDVYFTYTEEVGYANNPSYRLSVGRVSASSGPVAMTAAATRGGHHFEEITATGLVHAGTKVFLFTGGSAVSTESDDFGGASEWTLPDDGTVPASIPQRGLQGLLAGGRDGALTRFAFAHPPDIFGDPKDFAVGVADDATLDTFMTHGTSITFANAALKASTADTHLEGPHFLWFGRMDVTWIDLATGKRRASFPSPNPVGLPGTLLATGAMTFSTPPTATSAAFDLVFARSDADGSSIAFATVNCGP